MRTRRGTWCAKTEHLPLLCGVWLFALITSCGSASPEPTAPVSARSGLVRKVEYTIRFDPGLTEVTVLGCAGVKVSDWVRGSSDGLAERSFRTFEKDGESCMHSRVRLRDQGPRAVALRRGGLSLSTASLLRRPGRLSSAVQVSIHLVVPDGLHVLAPWSGSAPRYETDLLALRFDGTLSISKDAPLAFRESAVEVQAHVFSRDFDVSEAWIRSGLRTIHQLWGELPFRELHVVVMPVQTNRPVRFGFATRGSVGTVLVMPNVNATLDQLERDWVLPHELSHLVFPYLKDAWLSEGLATYYQEVLRARSGAIEPERAWSNLADGFVRGQNSSGDLPLRDLSESIHATASYVRVYWSGAALAFLLDVQLRESGTSLDQELRRIFTADRYGDVVTAEQVLDWLDRGVARGQAQRLCQKWLAEETFPPAHELLVALYPEPRTARSREIASAIMASTQPKK